MKTESRKIFALCLTLKENKGTVDLKPELTSQIETFPHQKPKSWDFSADPRVETPCFHAGGVGPVPGRRTKIARTCCTMQSKNKERIMLTSFEKFLKSQDVCVEC